MRVRGGSHRTAGRHVPHSGAGEEEAAAGDRCHADEGLRRPPEAARRCQVSSGRPAATTWTPAQAIVVNKCVSFVLPYSKN